jgi:basic membrane protein A
MMKRVDKGVYYATQIVIQGKFKDVVQKYQGVLTLGIGTVVEGIPMEGIKMSDLSDLDEFIQMGVRAEQLSGKKVLPMPPDQIKTKVQTMRSNEPQYIWKAVSELEEQIRTGKVTVPLPLTQEDIQQWRAQLG